GNSFIFPVGKGTVRPIGVVNASEETWKSEYFDNNPNTAVSNNVNLGSGPTGFGPDGGISSIEYWKLGTPTPATANGVVLYWNANSGVDNVNFVHVAEYDGNEWQNRGANNVQGIPNQGDVRSNAINFSEKFFTFGSTDLNVTPLPVELVAFNAEVVSEQVKLTWMTASEIDNSHFIIERSADGTVIEEVGRVYSKARGGNSIHKLSYRYFDESPLMGRSYYRLKQVDYDGTYEYSDWQMVEFIKVEEMNLRVYPNPSNGQNLTVEIETNFRANDLELQLFDLKGGLKWHQQLPLTNEYNFYKAQMDFGQPLKKGVYLLRMTTKSESVVKKIIVH
ncbi:MAG: T9SS type A sorting domain-containing protein, partial [Cryomorphaceae bacterium]|nr:T9SS type A sorting domain-containing protein [Cryomorphaceae bacterium]